MRRFVFFLVMAAMLAWCAPVQAFTGVVIKVSDGDTLIVRTDDGDAIKVRLYGVDAPEKSQEFGSLSAGYLSEQVYGREVDVYEMDTDQYGRTVGIVSVDGEMVQPGLLRSGFARLYGAYCRIDLCADWAVEEESARMGHRGLWSRSGQVAPWDYRREERMKGHRDRKKDADRRVVRPQPDGYKHIGKNWLF